MACWINWLGYQWYGLENDLLKLVQNLERKRGQGDWIDQLVVKDSHTDYEDD